MAGEVGEQTIILAFDQPQRVQKVGLEIEEPETSRTQELSLAVSRDGGHTYREVLRQEYNFAASYDVRTRIMDRSRGGHDTSSFDD